MKCFNLDAVRNLSLRRVSAAAAIAFVMTLGLTARAGWAQSQSGAESTSTPAVTASAQTTTGATSEATDPPDPPSDALADAETMFPHFKNTRFWLSRSE